MTNITLFKDTLNESVYNLATDLALVDVDEQDDDILITIDLCGMTLEYISTSEGVVLDNAYFIDGGYVNLHLKDFDIPELKNYIMKLVDDRMFEKFTKYNQ